jgi:XTP/dITP diphosphohydrolase
MPRTKLVFATHNQHKLKEVQALLRNFEVLSLTDINCTEPIPETAHTLEGNAKLKANFVTEYFGMNCFADDTGLEVDALNGAPGVYSARYAGSDNDSEKNIQKLLGELKNESNRKAQFRTVIALNLEGQQFLFEGICKGEILSSKKGKAGFGYDPVFKPMGCDKSFAEMSIQKKNLISHRAIGIQNLIGYLNEHS